MTQSLWSAADQLCRSMRPKTAFAAVLMAVTCGCFTAQKPDTSSWPPATACQAHGDHWEPSPDQQARAERLGRWFARANLDLNDSDIRKMRADFMGCCEDNSPFIWIQFYDPAQISPSSDGKIDPVFGGFPDYFTVTVDAAKWEVVDHYAEAE